jgi:hypothetical protein
MVFGQKATDKIIESDISNEIKIGLWNSKVYMEGRVIRFDLRNEILISDIKKLILVKIANY